MADLVARSACDGLLPLTRGDLTLKEADDQSLTCVMPFQGQGDALQQAGLVLPAMGVQVAAGNGILRWFGRNTYLSIGGALSEGIATHASLSDQSDAWARMILSGPQAEDVLVRLVPVDLRRSVFDIDQTCRSLFGHMNASITRVSEQAFEIMVFRSMAQTAVHDLEEAMRHVAARASNPS